MDFISLFILAAVIYGVVGMFTAKTSKSLRPPQRRTAPLPGQTTEWRPTPKMSRDVYKREEISQAQGIEGAWGDEGRAAQEQWSPEGKRAVPTGVVENFAAKLKTEDEDTFEFDTRSIIQGVIWAEILGRPRALRPYR